MSTPGAFYAICSTDKAWAGQRLQESKDTPAQGMAVGRVWGEIRIREKQEHIMMRARHSSEPDEMERATIGPVPGQYKSL